MKWLVDAAVATALLLCLIAQDEIGISVCRGYGSVLIADEIQLFGQTGRFLVEHSNVKPDG